MSSEATKLELLTAYLSVDSGLIGKYLAQQSIEKYFFQQGLYNSLLSVIFNQNEMSIINFFKLRVYFNFYY